MIIERHYCVAQALTAADVVAAFLEPAFYNATQQQKPQF